jgi:hypothetical protein
VIFQNRYNVEECYVRVRRASSLTRSTTTRPYEKGPQLSPGPRPATRDAEPPTPQTEGDQGLTPEALRATAAKMAQSLGYALYQRRSHPPGWTWGADRPTETHGPVRPRAVHDRCRGEAMKFRSGLLRRSHWTASYRVPGDPSGLLR